MNGVGPETELSPPQRLGLLIARADLGYVRAAIEPGHVERALAFLQHAVLVAFEAREFCTRQLGLDLPALRWDAHLAAACRTSNKYFDDNRRDITQLAIDVGEFAAANHREFTGGWRRRLGRALGIHNPDLGVLSVQEIPVTTNVNLSFQAGLPAPGPDGTAQAGRLVHDLAVGVGQMVAVLDAADTPHRAPAVHLDEDWSWGDGESIPCYAAAFAGATSTEYVPLLLMLQGASATAALLAETDCCADCRFAAFKHRLAVAHHVARSLELLRTAGLVGVDGLARLDHLLDADAHAVLALRPLRNGLVHLGLSDVPPAAFASDDPVGAVIRHYSAGQDCEAVDALVRRALGGLCRGLTEWLVEPPAGGVGFAELLRPPDIAGD